MDNNMNDKINELKRKKEFVYWISFAGWILSYYVKNSGLVIVLPMTEMMLTMVNMDNVYRSALLSFVRMYFEFLPLMVYIGGKLKRDSISNEILKLKNIDQGKEVAIKKEVSIEEQIKDEEEKIIKVYDIVDKIETLPRDKQMEILNYIKGSFNVDDNQLCNSIDELDERYKEMLQTECEDILFPDIDEDKDEYTRKRRK